MHSDLIIRVTSAFAAHRLTWFASVVCLAGYSSIRVVDGFGIQSSQPSARSATHHPLYSSSSVTPCSMDTTAVYAEPELVDALRSLYQGKSDLKNENEECGHMFGYGDKDHSLSMLQTITATCVLDYERFLQSPSAQSEADLLKEAAVFWETHGPILNLQTVLQSTAPGMALAAEFKRASPSKGDIAVDTDAREQARRYQGAQVLSCLTEFRWFKGRLQDLTDMRLESGALAGDLPSLRPAVLRKDFVVNRYMIAEAAAAGADTILLIVAVLPLSLLQDLINYSRELGMEPLVEVHADAELNVALTAGARVIGVNNRNLHTFQVDLATSERVARRLDDLGLEFRHGCETAEYTLCALSGMSTCWDVDRYRKAGLAMCLIGESLMRASDPAAAIAGLCLDPIDLANQDEVGGGGAYTAGTQLVKVCGVTNPHDALVACRAGANLVGVIFASGSPRCVTAAQAKEVVDVVRTFGERSQRAAVPGTAESSLSPTAHLSACSQQLVQAFRQRPGVVGVFQNQDPEFVRKMVKDCGLDMVQLHGQEGMAASNRANFGIPVIRVVDIAVDPETGQAQDNAVDVIMQSVTNDPDAILLDTSIKGNKQGGGTGISFDWSIAERIQAAGLPVLVAGGLDPATVGGCISSTRPFGVDVSSGVEETKGRKNHDKVKDFVQQARSAAVEANKGF